MRISDWSSDVCSSDLSVIGLVTADARHHASLTSLIEGMFMLGVLSSSWVFSAFIDPAGLRWLNAYWVLAGVTALALTLLLSARSEERRVGEECVSTCRSGG